MEDQQTAFFIKSLLLLAAIAFMLFAAVKQFLKRKKVIYVYSDEGVGEIVLKQTLAMLKTSVSKNFDIQTIEAEDVVEGSWIQNAGLFIMSGGADLLYVKKLNGIGNRTIKNFVKNGGSYLGLCAGAYYASSYCEFDKGGDLEVLGDRELAFFADKCIGPVLAKYNYKDLSGARAAVTDVYLGKYYEMKLYFNGGGYFQNAEDYNNVRVMGYYNMGDAQKLAAIIFVKHGMGRVVLSGVHFECDPTLLKASDPYLAKIIPDLMEDNSLRLVLLKDVFNKLNVK